MSGRLQFAMSNMFNISCVIADILKYRTSYSTSTFCTCPWTQDLENSLGDEGMIPRVAIDIIDIVTSSLRTLLSNTSSATVQSLGMPNINAKHIEDQN